MTQDILKMTYLATTKSDSYIWKCKSVHKPRQSMDTIHFDTIWIIKDFNNVKQVIESFTQGN